MPPPLLPLAVVEARHAEACGLRRRLLPLTPPVTAPNVVDTCPRPNLVRPYAAGHADPTIG
jgi:hypothetical protein